MTMTKILNGVKVLSSDLRSLWRREINFHRVRPTTSILFLTYRCNSKCETCTMWRRPHEIEIKREIDLKGWRSVIGKLADAGVTSAEIFGGNALLRKDVLIPLLQCLHEKGMAVHFPTNAIGLDDDVAAAIVKYVNTVYISIDGLGNKQDEIRGVAYASDISEDSITKLQRFRKENCWNWNNVRIVCNCTVSRFNIESMFDIAQYASDKGFDEIHYEYAGEFDKNDVAKSRIMDITPEPYFLKQEASILADKKGAERIKNSLLGIKKKFKHKDIIIDSINIDTLSTEDLYRGTIPHDKCYIERNVVTVDPYGNLVACPFINNYMMGNLLESSFEEIWNNEKHKYFRKTQNSGGLPMCNHCILGAQRNPGVMKSLERIYLSRIRPQLSY